MATTADGHWLATGMWGSVEIWSLPALFEAAGFNADDYDADPFAPLVGTALLKVGQPVTISSGTYSGFDATFVNADGQSATVEVELFGRKSEVSVALSQIGGHSGESRNQVLAFFRREIDMECEVATGEALRAFWRDVLEHPVDALADVWDAFPQFKTDTETQQFDLRDQRESELK
ncbi:MAG: hypothetical protein O3A00_29110, partial [Planctomycetota bacterium]|nr:hypothetical protein [Planctomycetota bacterium]